MQAVTLLIDVAFGYSAWDAFRVQNLLRFASWRKEDEDAVMVLVVVTLLTSGGSDLWLGSDSRKRVQARLTRLQRARNSVS